jgi:hypothetical protein
MKLRYLILPAMLFFAGCSTDVSLANIGLDSDSGICETEPKWVTNPPADKNFIYGVGVAPINFKGEQAQRKSAIAKAIDEIASQMSTTVNSKLITKTSTYNGRGSSSMNSVSFQTVNGQKVSAKIIKSCKNPNNGYFYVLMKAGK